MRRRLVRSSLNALLSSSRTSLILASGMRVDVRDVASRPGPGISHVVMLPLSALLLGVDERVPWRPSGDGW